MTTKNIMIVGVGGQGTLLTSRILGGLTIAGGYDVKLSEVHGMAQRGGLSLIHISLPKKLIREFAEKVETLYIVEELDPVIEEQVKSWGIRAIGKDIFTVQGEYLSLIHI